MDHFPVSPVAGSVGGRIPSRRSTSFGCNVLGYGSPGAIANSVRQDKIDNLADRAIAPCNRCDIIHFAFHLRDAHFWAPRRVRRLTEAEGRTDRLQCMRPHRLQAGAAPGFSSWPRPCPQLPDTPHRCPGTRARGNNWCFPTADDANAKARFTCPYDPVTIVRVEALQLDAIGRIIQAAVSHDAVDIKDQEFNAASTSGCVSFRGHRSGKLFDNGIDLFHLAKEAVQKSQRELTRGVTERFRRIGMHFEKESVTTRGNARPRNGKDELRLSRRFSSLRNLHLGVEPNALHRG